MVKRGVDSWVKGEATVESCNIDNTNNHEIAGNRPDRDPVGDSFVAACKPGFQAGLCEEVNCLQIDDQWSPGRAKAARRKPVTSRLDDHRR